MNRRRIRKRIAHLRARLHRDIEKLDAIEDGEKFRSPLLDLVTSAIKDQDETDGGSFEDLVNAVADWLDDKIEPRSPIAEFASDLGIDLAAWVAVTLYLGTAKRIAKRAKWTEAKIDQLEERLKG